MYEFMTKFYEAFPEYKGLDFFVTGESYAGHYVPAVSSAIFKGNQASPSAFQIPLKGFAIGNGMVNAAYQYPQYLPYAEEKKLITNPIIEKVLKSSEHEPHPKPSPTPSLYNRSLKARLISAPRPSQLIPPLQCLFAILSSWRSKQPVVISMFDSFNRMFLFSFF